MSSSDTNTPSLRSKFNPIVSGRFLVIFAGVSGAFAALTGDMSYLGLGALICGTGILIRHHQTPSDLSHPQPH